MVFYYRDQELKTLSAIYQQVDTSARMVVLTGRRRLGKTMLALQYVADKPYLYLFVSKKPEALLCEEYIKQIKSVFPDVPVFGEVRSFPEIFALLLEIAKTKPFVLIVDEFQEFMHINPAVYSDLQKHWDLHKAHAKLQVLFLGSVYSLMHQIFESYNEPLFGRADRIIQLKPFRLQELADILKSYGHADLETLFNYYIITGGVPKYIDLLLTQKVYTESEIINFVFSSDSPFLAEGRSVLIEEFGKDYGTYFAILELLAVGKTGRGEIESILQKNIGGFLERLDITYNVIQKYNPINAKPNTKKQKYRINDPFLQFWFRFIFRHRSAIEMENFDYTKAIYEQDKATYQGRLLEDFFHDLFKQSHQFNHVGTYWNREGHDEIDLVALNDLEKRCVIAEIKRNKSKISIAKLQAKAESLILAYPNYRIEYRALGLEDARAYLQGA